MRPFSFSPGVSLEDTPDRRAAYIQGAIRGTLTFMERALAASERDEANGEIRQARGRVRATETHVLALRTLLEEVEPPEESPPVDPPVDVPPIEEPEEEPELPIEEPEDDPPPPPPPPPPVTGPTSYLLPAEIAESAARGADQTVAIQAWMNGTPDGSTLVFRPGVYGIDGGLVLRNRQGLTFDGAGATFTAAYSDNRKRAHWLFTASSDITIRNMILLGPIVETAGVSGPYVPALVAQFGVGLSGVQGAIVEDVTVKGVYADCFYAGGGSVAAGATRNVIVRRMVCEGTGRHGMAFTNAENVLVEDSYIGDIRWSGIDVEPGAEGLLARNIEFRRNTFGLVRHYLLTVGGKSDWPNVGNIKFNDNTQVATHPTSTEAIRLAGSEIGFRQHFEVSRNTFQPYGGIATLSRVSDVVMEDNRVTGRIGTSGYKHIELADVHDSSFRNNGQGVPVKVVYKEGAVPSTGIVEVP